MNDPERSVSETIDYILSILMELEHEGVAVEPIRYTDTENDHSNPDHDYAIRVVMPVALVDDTTKCVVVNTSVNITRLQRQNDVAFGMSLANLMEGILDSLGERDAADASGTTLHQSQLDTTTH